MRAYEDLDREVAQYIADVKGGRVVAGRLVRLAVERHLRDLRNGKKRGLRYNRLRARRAIWWVQNRCRHSKGRWANEPFVLAPWQKFILAQIFGWERLRDSGWRRRYRTAFVRIARKNGKSELAAAVGLIMLLLTGETEPGAEVYSAATTREQASLTWQAAHQMVKKSPLLRREVKQVSSRYTLTHVDTGSKFSAVASDHDTLDGLSPLLNIIDEYHAHPDSKVRDVLDSGMGARREPLTLIITTAGERRSGPCWDQEVDCVRALEAVGEEAGTYDDVFAYIAQLDDGDDPFNETVWEKANPNIGVSIELDAMRIEATVARRKPSALLEFLRKRCNLYTETSNAWIQLDAWDAMKEAPPADERNKMLPPPPPAGEKKKRSVVALDLSATMDYTFGLAMLEPDEAGMQDIYCAPFIPADTLIDRMNRDRAPVKTWSDEGWLVATPGNVVDQDALKEWLVNLRDRVEVLEVSMDPHNASKLQTELMALGFNVVAVTQTAPSMSPLIKETEKAIHSKRFRHGGHPVLRWMMANVACTKDSKENYFLNKQKSRDRIDGAVCLCMARGRWEHQKAPRQMSLSVMVLG